MFCFIIDWLKLRRDHRIIGELVGSFPKLTRQDVFLGLPLLLLPEEITLLVEKKIAYLVECTSLKAQPDQSLSQRFQEYREKLFLEQADCLKDNRKKQVVIYIVIYIYFFFFFTLRGIYNRVANNEFFLRLHP